MSEDKVVLIESWLLLSSSSLSYSKRWVQLELDREDLLLRVINSKLNVDFEVDLLNCFVDTENRVDESDKAFIASLSSNDVDVILHRPSEDYTMQDNWKKILQICNNYFELYVVCTDHNDNKPREIRELVFGFSDSILLLNILESPTHSITKTKTFTYFTSVTDYSTYISVQPFNINISTTNKQYYNLYSLLKLFEVPQLNIKSERIVFDEEKKELELLKDRNSVVYEEDCNFFMIEKWKDCNYFHRELNGSSFNYLISDLGFPDLTRVINFSSDVKLPYVPYTYEWFWPQITYEQAEYLLNKHTANYFLIRMSESKPGHFALSAGFGPKGGKRFKHFYIRYTGKRKYKLGSKPRLFASFVEIVEHFTQVHQYRYLPYEARRSTSWRNSINSFERGRLNRSTMDIRRAQSTKGLASYRLRKTRSTHNAFVKRPERKIDYSSS